MTQAEKAGLPHDQLIRRFFITDLIACALSVR
jgi:hypothetical protein